MDIHDEIYRNKTPDVTTQEGKATPDSGIDVASILDTKAFGNEVLPETIVEESDGEKSTEKSASGEEKQREQRPVSAVDEGIGVEEKLNSENVEHPTVDHKDAEGEEGEEEDPEMSEEDKEEMYRAVIRGDIELLDDLLDKPGADLNMEWFEENLLMAAIRNSEETMAEFLIDNGVNRNYKATQMDMKSKNPMPAIDWYSVSCRQVAYDHDMMSIVELIDELNGDLWSFLQPRERVIRLKRSLEEKLRERGEWVSEEEDDGQQGDDEGSILSVNGTRRKRKWKRKDADAGDTTSNKSGSSEGSKSGSKTPESKTGRDKPGDDHVGECLKEVMFDTKKENKTDFNNKCCNVPLQRDNISSGYESQSHSSSMLGVDSIFVDVQDPFNPPPSPHKYRQTKSSLTRLRHTRATKLAGSYDGVLGEDPPQSRGFGNYSTVNKQRKSPSLRRHIDMYPQDHHKSPFVDRLNSNLALAPDKLQTFSVSNKTMLGRKWDKTGTCPIRPSGGDASYGRMFFRRAVTFPHLNTQTKRPPISDTMRSSSTLMSGNGRGTSRHVLTCVSPSYLDMSNDMKAPTTRSPSPSRPVSVCSNRLLSPSSSGRNRGNGVNGSRNWKASTTWADEQEDDLVTRPRGKKPTYIKKYSPAGHVKVGRGSEGVPDLHFKQISPRYMYL